MKRKKKCCFFFLSVCCFIPIFIFSVLVVTWEIQKKTDDASMKTGSNFSNACFGQNCGGGWLFPPFSVLGSSCGSPFLQIKCLRRDYDGLGYLYPNNLSTNMLVTSVNYSSSWSSGNLSIVPHPSMSTCSHIRRANFSSLFRNLRSLSQFRLHAMNSSSLLFFNCNSPQAVREEEYPPGIYYGGEACTRFSQSCLTSRSTLDCLQLKNIEGNNRSNSTEALIDKLGCTCFTSSVENWDNDDVGKPWPKNTATGIVVGWERLPHYDICDSLAYYCYCGYFANGSFQTYCSDKATDYLPILGSSLVYSSFIILVILVVACVVKRQSIMLWLTGERYFKLQDLHEPPKEMSYRLLDWATRSFTTKIGEGGFGQVYSGILPRQKTPIAVKVLENARHSQGQFVAEVASIGNLHHLNLVRLIGFCSHKDKRLLVYEYVPNGSLDKHLFPNSNQNQNQNDNEARSNENGLSWERRYSIIQGVGRGLAYLHHECREQVVHLDIKPANILLDHDFNPKIADFGLAKLMNRNQSKAETVVRGTLGYMAPELWKNSTVSTKCDVYSFGVLAIEVIAGRKLLEIDALSSQLYLTNWAFKKAVAEDYLPLVDQRVACPEIIEQAKNLILISMWCIQQDPCLRPSMMKVVEFIEGKDLVPSNPPNPFEGTLNTRDPIQELSANYSTGSSM